MYLNHCDIIRHPNGTAVVKGPCTVTGKEYATPPVPTPAVEAYLAGRGYAHDLFPMLADAEREFLISGLHPRAGKSARRRRSRKTEGTGATTSTGPRTSAGRVISTTPPGRVPRRTSEDVL